MHIKRESTNSNGYHWRISHHRILYYSRYWGGDSEMAKSIQIEVISTGMKAKLSPTYRRNLELARRQDRSELMKNFNQNNQTTALPFTTKTKAYGTYVWRR